MIKNKNTTIFNHTILCIFQSSYLSRLGDRQCSLTHISYLVLTQDPSALHTSSVSLSHTLSINDTLNSWITANIMALEIFKSVHLTSTDQASEKGTNKLESLDMKLSSILPSSPRAFRHCENEAFQGFLGKKLHPSERHSHALPHTRTSDFVAFHLKL